MTIRYPNGTPSNNYSPQKPTKKQGQTFQGNPTIFGNRGMTLEDAINESNAYYLEHGLGVIHKKPTPIQIVKVDYPKRSAAVIKEAYFTKASTTDYNGVFLGRYLDFEAKETKNKTSFPLNNFHEHQIKHFKACLKQGGICFVILYFSTLGRYFVFPGTALIQSFDTQVTGKKSIPLKEIIATGWEIKEGFAPRLPYLTVIEKIIQEEKENG